jgi:hypothetical protein
MSEKIEDCQGRIEPVSRYFEVGREYYLDFTKAE